MDGELPLLIGKALLFVLAALTLFFLGLPRRDRLGAVMVILGIIVLVAAIDKVMDIDEHRTQSSIVKFGEGSTDGR